MLSGLERATVCYEHKIGPRNGARVVARAWVDPNYKERLLTDATAAIGELGYTISFKGALHHLSLHRLSHRGCSRASSPLRLAPSLPNEKYATAYLSVRKRTDELQNTTPLPFLVSITVPRSRDRSSKLFRC